MSPLEVFGLCFGFTFLIIFLAFATLGRGFSMLLFIFPAIIAEKITSEHGMDFSKKSVIYWVFTFFFAALQVLLIAFIFYCICCFFSGQAISGLFTPVTFTFEEASIPLLKNLNKLLVCTTTALCCNFIFNIIKNRERNKAMEKRWKFQYLLLPAIGFVFAFLYLYFSFNNLNTFPVVEKSLTVRLISIVYVIYLAYNLGKTIYMYSQYFKSIFSEYRFLNWFWLLIQWGNSFVFLYFFYRSFSFLC